MNIKVISTGTPIKVITNQVPGATGATGAAGPNAVTSATASDGTASLILSSLRIQTLEQGNALFVAPGGQIQEISRYEIDTRTTFPNDSVSNATPLATPNALVMRDNLGEIEVKGAFFDLSVGNAFLVKFDGHAHFQADEHVGIIANGGLTWTLDSIGNPTFSSSHSASMPSLRATLGSGITGDALFTANTPNAAMNALGVHQHFQSVNSATPLATPNTLVMRSSSNESDFFGIRFTRVNELCKIKGANELSFLSFLTTQDENDYSTNIQFNADFYNFESLLKAASFRTACGSGTTGDALFTANTPNAAMNALGVHQHFQSVNSAPRTSNVFLTSTELQPITLQPGITYMVESCLIFTATSGAGIAIRFFVPNVDGVFVYGSNGNINIISPGPDLFIYGQTTDFIKAPNIGRGYLRVTTNTTLSFQWCTNAVNGTHNAFMNAGSFIRVTPISGNI